MRTRKKFVTLALAVICGISVMITSVKAESFTFIVSENIEYSNEDDVLTERCGLEYTAEIVNIEQETWRTYVGNRNSATVSEDEANYWRSFSSLFYYNQLSDTRKAIWDGLETSCLEIITSNQYYDCADVFLENKENLSYAEIFDTVEMFKYSHPQYFFLESSWSAGKWDESVYIKIKIYDNFFDGETRREATDLFKKKVDEWVAQVASVPREEDKLKKAYEIIAQNVEYDRKEESVYGQSAYSVVYDGVTVCAGYAAMLQILLNSNGVDTVEVTSKNHGWNLVKLHEFWYMADITWDDNGDYAGYDFYAKSEATILKLDGGSSHNVSAKWQEYLPELKFDAVNGIYLSTYFADDNFIYFRVNDNVDCAERCVKKIDTVDNQGTAFIPQYVINNNTRYLVLEYIPNTSKKLAPPDGLKWDENVPGKVIFNGVPYGEDENGHHYYRINILKDNQYAGYISMSTSQKDNVITNDVVMHHIEKYGEGNYTFQVCAVSKNDVYADSDYSTVPDNFTYKVPSIQLNAPKNIRLDGTVLKWDAVKNAGCYEIQIFVDGMYKARYMPSSTSQDITSYIERFGNGVYTFSVSACSGNISQYRSSEFTSSVEYSIGEQKPDETSSNKLKAPKNPRIDTTGNKCFTTAFMWDEVDGASKYEVEYYCNGETRVVAAYSMLYYPVIPSGTECSFTFRVRAVNASGESGEWSTAVDYQYVEPINQLAVPNNVKWDENSLTIAWSPVEGASGYQVILKCNGKYVAGYSGKYPTYNYDFAKYFKDEGVYTVTVCAYPSDINVCSKSQGGESSELSYIPPEQKMQTPANFQFDYNSTVLMWGEIDSVTRYNYEIYCNGEKQSSSYSSWNGIGLKRYLEKLEENEELLIKVQAVSYDKLHYADSDWAEFRYVKPSKKLDMPTDVKWDTEHFGTITWNPVEGAVSYIANLYCDGKQVIQYTIKTCKNDFSMHMFDSGNYTVEIYAVPADSSEIESSDIVRSGSLEYKAPQQKISVPVNIYWQGTVLKWDAVKDASRYEIACFLNGQRTAWGYYIGTSYDVKFYLDKYGSNDCTFKIRAISNDITKYGHSAYADTPEYDTGGTSEYPNEGQEQQVRNFVKRLYQVILNREAEEEGLNAWTKQLLGRKATGAQLVAGFVESDEFTQRGLTNEEVVEIMYQAMLGRTSDEGGKAGWSKILNNGCSYLNIVNGFSGSAEFNEICGSYGIIAGTVELNRQRDKNPQLTAFVARCYTQALDRQYETGGLEAWCDAIITGRNTPKQVAQNFIFSAEFVQKDLNDEEYVKVLYRTFMGREADEGGLAAWVNVLKSGRENRAKVLEGFSDSVEFAEILQSFGLR